jgi:hypothetical protein
MTDCRQPWRRLTADQLKSARAEVGLSGSGLAYLLSMRTDRIRDWLQGTEDPPLYLDAYLALLTLPGARDLVLRVIRRQAVEHDIENLLDWREPEPHEPRPPDEWIGPIAFATLPVRARHALRFQLGLWGNKEPKPKEAAHLSRADFAASGNQDSLAAIENWLASHGHRLQP